MRETMQDRVKDVTQTIEGYTIKDLTWLDRDNLYRGLVQDPIRGRATLHNGFIVCTWRKNGKLTAKYGGADRNDLDIIITNEKR